jgi:hypothetical protein
MLCTNKCDKEQEKIGNIILKLKKTNSMIYIYDF